MPLILMLNIVLGDVNAIFNVEAKKQMIEYAVEFSYAANI